jgi:hypothetical protein
MRGPNPYAPKHGRVRELFKAATYRLPFPLYLLGHGAYSYHRGRRITIPDHSGFLPTNRMATLRPPGDVADTLFVLGSGSSINRLSPAQWARVERAHSVGFNFWIIHDHVPTYFVFEQRTGSERATAFYRLLEMRADDYQGVPLLMKSTVGGLDRIPSGLRPGLTASPTFEVPGRSRPELRRALDLSRRLGIWRPGDPGMIPTKRASLSYMLFFGWFLGYRRIVLLGVDLNNTRYFYEERRDEYQALGRPVPESGQLGTIHRTVDRRVDPLTIDEVVHEINHTYLRPNGVRLFVGSRSSALYPALPYFEDW